MQQRNSSWRNPYHAAALTYIQSLALERLESNPPSFSVRATMSNVSHASTRYPVIGMGTTIIEYYHNSNAHKLVPSATLVLGASTADDQAGYCFPNAIPGTLQTPENRESYVTSSDLYSDDSLVSSPSQTTVTTCRFCPDRSFGGTPQSQRRSYKRHLRSDHSDGPKILCPVEDCGKSFQAGRSDNLKRHVKQQHPGLSLPYSPITGKRPAELITGGIVEASAEKNRKRLRVSSPAI